ncbi:hypothetical protein XSR1_150001 [Xenorhabdus szentirmaii DSM 16338]|uniref:Uncharacterized protein n=1 Tax=Xenorhabdus szentirmaii DSM 16338 TaxID=1427518 RepID=W1IWQ0_9GAMM|nr:hypothetical protein XSR1_150001 [Xenorhabdus szentirmaii DSM 16338]
MRFKNGLFVGYYVFLGEKKTNENKIQKNYCQSQKTPYNAPPLTDAELRHAAEGSERKAKINA